MSAAYERVAYQHGLSEGADLPAPQVTATDRVAYQGERIPLSSILSAAPFTSRATRIASFTSSSEGPGVSVLGYSKLFRARRSLLNERSARILDPN